jgi:tripartite-type tricarboxylate transporter receptor subunit TctC
LLVSPATSLVVNQSLYPRLPFDPTAFVPVTVLADQSNILVARPNLPVSNARELIA